MKKYKPFREQYLECTENGNLSSDFCPWDGKELSICKKYGKFCCSKWCREERMKGIENET